MTDSILILVFLVFALSLATLYLSRIYLTNNKVFAGGDVFFHLLISKSIRKNKWAYPSSLQNVTFDEGETKYNYLAYPPLLHYLTALFPLKTYLTVCKILNLLLLSFLSSLTAFLVYSLSFNFSIAIIAGFVTIFNFAVFELEVVFTPRPLGLLFYSFLMVTVIFYPQSLFSVLAITVLSSLVILTHKFAIQVLIFTLVPYAVLFNEPFLLVSLLLGFLLSIVLTRGRYLKVLKEHFGWLYFYSHFSLHGDYINKLKRLFARNIWYLLVFISLFFFLSQQNSIFLADTTLKLFFWAFVPLIAALLTTLPALSFLGENYRYIDYSVVPVGVISALLLSNFNAYVLLIFLICFLVSTAVLLMYKKHIYQSNWLVDPGDILSYQDLKGCFLSNLLVFPPNRTLEVNYFTGLSVIHPVRMKTSETLTEFFERLLRNYKLRYVFRFKGAAHTGSNDTFSIFENMVRLKTIMVFKNFEILEVSPKQKLVSDF